MAPGPLGLQKYELKKYILGGRGPSSLLVGYTLVIQPIDGLHDIKDFTKILVHNYVGHLLYMSQSATTLYSAGGGGVTISFFEFKNE